MILMLESGSIPVMMQCFLASSFGLFEWCQLVVKPDDVNCWGDDQVLTQQLISIMHFQHQSSCSCHGTPLGAPWQLRLGFW